MSLQMVNPNANSISVDALEINVRAAISLKELLKTNLGPKGKLKMLVSGAGDLTLTKDGAVLLKQMQIEHPTACVIARNAAAQDQISGDGSTSLVLFIGELLQKSAQLVADGVHPRNISDGIELGRKDALRFLEHFAKDVSEDLVKDREFICAVASSSLRTKLPRAEADHLTGIVVDSVMSIRREGRETDLFMVEVVTMEHKSVLDSVLVDGLVLDHGFRHPRFYIKD
ncbi:hypothetical protein MHBO_001362 [Bonamia ostreae]|uniref:Uncharacterized protein n=1 Tax=Bonamia ostreae TaxID=126728 RepID=A0ABV2AJX1_9EUKA